MDRYVLKQQHCRKLPNLCPKGATFCARIVRSKGVADANGRIQDQKPPRFSITRFHSLDLGLDYYLMYVP